MKITADTVLDLGPCWDDSEIVSIFCYIAESLGRNWITPSEVMALTNFKGSDDIGSGNREWVIETLYLNCMFLDTAPLAVPRIRETVEMATALGDRLVDFEESGRLLSILNDIEAWLKEPSHDAILDIRSALDHVNVQQSKNGYSGHSLTPKWYIQRIWFAIWQALKDITDECLYQSVPGADIFFAALSSCNIARVGIRLIDTTLPEGVSEMFDALREIVQAEDEALLQLLISTLESIGE